MNARQTLSRPGPLMGLALAVAALSAPALAAGQGTPDVTHSVALRGVDLHPASPAAARHLLRKIDEAALDACGGSPFSLRETRDAIEASSCWKDAVADAVRQTQNPLLADALEHRHKRSA